MGELFNLEKSGGRGKNGCTREELLAFEVQIAKNTPLAQIGEIVAAEIKQKYNVTVKARSTYFMQFIRHQKYQNWVRNLEKAVKSGKATDAQKETFEAANEIRQGGTRLQLATLYCDVNKTKSLAEAA